ncbi:MAG: DUF411 domain-containing protein [bacterium]
MKRRILLKSMLASAIGVHLHAQAALPTIEVYKTPTCGCCHLWVEHLRTNGFNVNAHDVDDTTGYRQKFGVPQALGSCHTGVVGGYALEGHVPAREIKRLLAERPKIKGLAVPAMVLGSPGMEGPRSDPYDVLAFRTDGRTTVYQHYNGSSK